MSWKLKVSASFHGAQAKYELLWQPVKVRWMLSKLTPMNTHRRVGGMYERPHPMAYNPDLGPTDIAAALEWAATSIALSEEP